MAWAFWSAWPPQNTNMNKGEAADKPRDTLSGYSDPSMFPN